MIEETQARGNPLASSSSSQGRLGPLRTKMFIQSGGFVFKLRRVREEVVGALF